MVTNIAVPDSSLLLLRPSQAITGTPPHPGATPVLPSTDPDYITISSWITGALTSCGP
jgi:hypothetical protein